MSLEIAYIILRNKLPKCVAKHIIKNEFPSRYWTSEFEKTLNIIKQIKNDEFIKKFGSINLTAEPFLQIHVKIIKNWFRK